MVRRLAGASVLRQDAPGDSHKGAGKGLMAREAYVFRDQGVVVFWSRKAGNTSLAEWLSGNFAEEPGAVGRPTQFMRKNSEMRVGYREALAAVAKGASRDFVLARHPVARAVSAFIEKFCYRDGPITRIAALRPFAQRAFLDIMKTAGRPHELHDYRDHYPGISFVDFLTYVREGHRTLRGDGEPRLNAHFSSQVPFYFDGRHRYGSVIRLEHVQDEIRPLAEALGMREPFPHARRNDRTQAPEGEGDLSAVAWSEMLASGIVPTPSSLLNERTAAMIREIYDIDFRMLGYA
jgi:hypothetical protein